ncbi:MAG: hypothetical protein RL511_929, partial [Bacteroidota bacterium]
LRSSQVYFKWYGGFFRKALQCVTYFGVQNENTKNLLLKIGVKQERIEILGDLRFNRVLAAKATSKPNALIEKFVDASPLLILGSSWPAEEKILSDFMDKHKDILTKLNLKILIAPHDLSERHLAQLAITFPQAIFYSKMDEHSFSQTSMMILDTIGHLSAAYQYGAIAFVGGGFSGRLHNILEPLAFGLPVIFGPKHQKFPEAQQFLDLGFASVIENEQDFGQLLKATIDNSENQKKAIEKEVFNLQVKMSPKIVA